MQAALTEAQERLLRRLGERGTRLFYDGRVGDGLVRRGLATGTTRVDRGARGKRWVTREYLLTEAGVAAARELTEG